MIDCHAHLDIPPLLPDLAGILERAKQAGLTHILNVGERTSSSQASVALARQHEQIYAVVGIHPDNAREWADAENRQQLEQLLQQPKVQAVGEIGLDYYRIQPEDEQSRKIQRAAFLGQIELAKKYNLPVVIHSRNAPEDTFEIIRDSGLEKVVMHCYAYDVAWAEKFLGLNENYLISFTGIVTFPNAHMNQEVAKHIPLPRMTAETDCPFLAPQKYRGQRNEPAYVTEVVKKIAELKEITQAEAEQQTDANARRFFNLE